MTCRIKILSEQLANKIAAGEVVERPASVVKELVENSLDAGSAEIIVEIEGGGKRLIKVTDNGSGMSREDALLALERHATSKIASADDLFGLTTLGFRGEALPSIASVSRLTLASRERGAIEGTEIYLEGGKVREVKACGMAEGTVIAVRNLFFNTPARLKFMKSPETETGHVGEILTRLALSRPQVRFTYLNEGKTVFRALPGDLPSRAASLLGSKLATDLLPLEYRDEALAMHGLVGGPETNRSTASSLYTFINGRFIRDRVVQHAILQAYRQVLERGRYPAVVLFIELPSGEVDVNVHPTKHEVRFREQGRVHDLIQGAIETHLRETPWLKRSVAGPPVSPSATRIAEVRDSLQSYAAGQPRQESFPRSWPHAGVSATDAKGGGRPSLLTSGMVATEEVMQSTGDNDRAAPRAEAAEEVGYFSSLWVIGQFQGAYILCQAGSDLVLIDQHAAHERVVYERLRQEFAAGRIEGQGLLFPESLELSHAESATLREHHGELDRLGFELEHFGGNTWLLKGCPRLLSGNHSLRTLRDLLEELQGLGRSRTFDDAVEDILATVACHSVVRGSRNLSLPEIRELFAQMDATGFAGNCPHGRPVARTITLAEIERMFKRG